MSATLVDGQIYRWQWSDAKRHEDGQRSWSTYHCRSQIAVVKDGKLYDTFWGSPSYGHVLDPAQVTLTLWGDESWQTISKWKTIYYDHADIVDTRHSNNSSAPIYLRPGAKRSEAAVIQEIDYRKEKAESAIRHAGYEIERLAAARQLVADGKLDEVML